MKLTFDPPQLFSTVVLVGLGGTGSNWARSLCRTVYDMQQRRLHTPAIVFVDPDRVEAKNVGRQMFVEGELGQFKAEVLARRFSYSLGLPIRCFTTPFEAQRHANRQTLLLGAVDNHQARQELVRAVDQHGLTLIDAGNHANAGQITVGNCGDPERILAAIRRDGTCPYLPHVGLVFPSLLEPEGDTSTTPAASCAELVELGSQHLLINELMASAAAQYSYRLLHRQKLETALTYIDGDALAMRSPQLTLPDLRYTLTGAD